ncbi:dermonecrotic toxin domain-containing protein [Pseudomonas sp. L1(2025)]|uniref:dermonecrotic toxin domain-containing protein n=1 Tax=Pseudomonas sp. L1(2025) TaxID=3449429 RepID=UPI003F68F47A
MTGVTPAYFFDELLLPIKRNSPSARERALGLSVKDLDWLYGVYQATHAARQDSRLQTYPMSVERLLINVSGQAPIPLAGAFLMSPAPDDGKAVLYTPYGGIQVFDDHATLLEQVGEQLENAVQRVELMHFLSIAQRNALPLNTPITLTTTLVEGAVMQDQEQTLEDCQQANVRMMLEQLQKTPTLRAMLDTVLGIMARSYFPTLNQRDTRVDFFVQTPAGDHGRWVNSLPLSEAFLEFYVKHAWSKDQTRVFINPKHDTSAFTPAERKQDQQHWETLIKETSGSLSKLLGSLLQTYWNEDIGNETSRLELFTQVMAEKFRLDILLKRQNQIISAEESHTLQAMFLADQRARSAHAKKLNVEKVRIYAPYQHFVELASTLMISETHAYLYTQSRGLQVLKDMADLKDTLLSMLKAAGHEDELLNFLSLDERNTFIGLDQINIAARPIPGDVFTGMLEDIAAKQVSNMNHALALYRRSDGQVNLDALLDCALDIRAMLDNRLDPLETAGRWTAHPITSGNGRPSTVQAERAKQHLQRLQAAEQALATESEQHPTLRTMVAVALNAELQSQRLDLKADEVYINTYPTQAEEREERPALTSVSMVDHFIERLSGEARPLPNTRKIGFYQMLEPHVALRLPSLTLSTFNMVNEQVLKVFANHEMRQLPLLFLSNMRKKHAHSMLLGLRSEAELRLLNDTLSPGSQAVLDTVLRPDSLVRLTRHGLNGFLPDAYALTLFAGTSDTAQALANAFTLTERGGTDPQRSGRAVLWTPRRGHEVFTSIQALREAITRRLEHPILRLPLLENLPISLRIPHQVYRLGPLQRIDDNLLDNRVSSYGDAVMDGVDHLLSMNFAARALQDRMDTLMQQTAPTNLARAIAVASAMKHQQALPVWLGMAPPREQIHQAELLEQYHNNAPEEEDYLHGITPIRTHTHAALLALLKARFPHQALDPDDVLIPVHQALDVHVYNLTDFALRHWPHLDAENILPRSRTTVALPATLDASAIVQMVRQLDLKTAYQKRLQNHLDVQTDEGRQRRRLFCRQLPWQTLHYAHEQKLQERLTAAALSSVQQVFDMPDALARTALEGASAMIRPLELIATEGATLAKVLGMYLIGPETEGSGPLVLFAPYSENHVLKEYPNAQALLDELGRPGELQDWVILHLEAPHQAIYRNLLQNNPHRPYDIRLASSAVTGNALHYLFSENTLILHKMLACQFENGCAAIWNNMIHLLEGAITAAARFMAGKLAYPLVVWRSYTLFKRSADELQLHHWKAGLKDFINGVAQMAVLYTELEGSDAAPPTETEVSQANLSGETLPTANTLATLSITAPSRTRLQPFESHDVALKDLELGAVSHVYTDKATSNNYVPVAGKVYSVKKTDDHWRLANDEQEGPAIGRNSDDKWVLDLSRHNPRFGKTLSRMHTRAGEREAINIEASGIRAIAALSSWKAQVINEALNVATYYAVNCKRNIVHFAQQRAPDSRVGLFLGELFGVISLTPAQVSRVERIVDVILDELSDPTLTSTDSRRFVSGTSRISAAHQYAFVIPQDRERKLYLLNRFFDPCMDNYQNRLNSPFDLSAHARASVLIHELTHLKLDTEDIAYLDAMRPFPDLINAAKPGAKLLKTTLEDLRSTALSTLTPATMLFKTWDDFSAEWEDYGPDTATTHVKQKVLSTTGTKDLRDARDVFMSNPDKRIDTILANADSVTYLITHLGRLLETGA